MFWIIVSALIFVSLLPVILTVLFWIVVIIGVVINDLIHDFKKGKDKVE